MQLVMDADSICGFSVSTLLALLAHVQIRPSQFRAGISSLTANALRSGSLRLCRRMAQLGLLAIEPVEALLAFYDDIYGDRADPFDACFSVSDRPHGNTALRALLLMEGRPQPAEKAELAMPAPERLDCWQDRWSRVISPEWVAELFRGDLSSAECHQRLLTLKTEDFLFSSAWRLLRMPEGIPFGHPRWGEITAFSFMHAACCGDGVGPAQLFEYGLGTLRGTVDTHIYPFYGTEATLQGSPLCWAAAVGRVEKVRALLALMDDPDELSSGTTNTLGFGESYRDYFEFYSTPITPFLCALLQGEEETARLLLSAGAHCDLGERVYRRLLLAFASPAAMALAARLPGIGFERIPAADLEAFYSK